MNSWRALPQRLAREAQVLVTVAQVRGSAPREAGASMLVGAQDSCDTIGGGRLEWEAIAYARQMLTQPAVTPVLLRFPLAASLGQCCGGVVWLLFERIAVSEQPAWRQHLAELEVGQTLLRQCAEDEPSCWLIAPPRSPDVGRRPESGTALELGEIPGFRAVASGLQPAQSWTFHQPISLPRFPVTIFGAGHVGEAIVRALLPLEAQIRWVDTREDVFPAELAAQVACITTDAPEQEIARAPAGSMLLVLTHSHAIDLELCAVGLRREDLDFFGLIGSRAKRARFEQRLLLRSLLPVHLARLNCPIGIAGIRSKQPAVIAAAVVAQLLQVRELSLNKTAALPIDENNEHLSPC